MGKLDNDESESEEAPSWSYVMELEGTLWSILHSMNAGEYKKAHEMARAACRKMYDEAKGTDDSTT